MLGYAKGKYYLCNKDEDMKIKTGIYIGIGVLLMGLCIVLTYSLVRYRNLEKQWETAMGNVKAYSDQCSTLQNSNRAFKLTIDQLESSSDSIFQELDAARKELKIKNSKLQSMQYVSSSFTKADTIVLKDTIFKDSTVGVDTLLSDEWYSVGVMLKYPSTIAIKPEFKSIKNIVVSVKRETVNPPKKFFLWRWFQKKHNVVRVDVVEKNPYVKDENSRYIEIVK